MPIEQNGSTGAVPSGRFEPHAVRTADDDACRQWRATPAATRCRAVADAAAELAAHADPWVTELTHPGRPDPVEPLTAEIFPTCAALKWIGRRGSKLLAVRRPRWRLRPAWLLGVDTRVHREPRGEVLIIGTWNYPLFLTGVQIATSVAAGNHTIVKPATGCVELTQKFCEHLHRAGVPNVITILDESVDAARRAIASRVDLVVMTGSADTGREVMRQCAEHLTPSIIEASGCDAMVALPGADAVAFAKRLRFGLTLNSGATCIAPRRLFIHRDDRDRMVNAIGDQFADVAPMVVAPPARHGVAQMMSDVASDQWIIGGPVDASFAHDGTMMPSIRWKRTQSGLPPDPLESTDVFGPVAMAETYDEIDPLVARVNACDYALAASIHGDPKTADKVARRIEAGFVVINDVIVPTADPRVPFGGRRRSGHGVTRGDEGLLAMTQPKVVATRRRFAMHLRPRDANDYPRMLKALRWLHR